MNAPPSFQFYASDFVGGTMSFTAEQTGAYILLLCYQWMNGKIPADDTALMAIGRCSSAALAVVKTKFVTASDGFGLINIRLETVRTEQNQYRAKQAENGRKGGLLTKHRSSTAQATLPAPLERASSSPSPSPSPISTSTVTASTAQAPLVSACSDLLALLGSAIYARPKDQWPTEPEQRAAIEVLKRPNSKSEVEAILAFSKKLRPEDRRFQMPQTLSRLLSDWNETLDKARTYQPIDANGQLRKKPPKPHVDCWWSETEWRWVDQTQ